MMVFYNFILVSLPDFTKPVTFHEEYENENRIQTNINIIKSLKDEFKLEYPKINKKIKYLDLSVFDDNCTGIHITTYQTDINRLDTKIDVTKWSLEKNRIYELTKKLQLNKKSSLSTQLSYLARKEFNDCNKVNILISYDYEINNKIIPTVYCPQYTNFGITALLGWYYTKHEMNTLPNSESLIIKILPQYTIFSLVKVSDKTITTISPSFISNVGSISIIDRIKKYYEERNCRLPKWSNSRFIEQWKHSYDSENYYFQPISKKYGDDTYTMSKITLHHEVLFSLHKNLLRDMHKYCNSNNIKNPNYVVVVDHHNFHIPVDFINLSFPESEIHIGTNSRWCGIGSGIISSNKYLKNYKICNYENFN